VTLRAKAGKLGGNGNRAPIRLRPNVPVAIQIANLLRVQLRTDYAEGGRLPGENAMAAEMGVSRGTVRQALAILQHEGLISRHQGSGTYANPNVLGIPARIDFAYEFSELITASGYQSTIKTLEIRQEAASSATASALDIKPGAPVLYLRKLFLANGQPAIYVHELLSTALILEPYEHAELEQPMWHFIERRCHRQLKYGLSELIPSLAVDDVAELLAVAAGSPVLKFDEVFFGIHNEPLTQAIIYFHEPLIRFHALRKVSMIN
jgi:GntR family transcriptional regulator